MRVHNYKEHPDLLTERQWLDNKRVLNLDAKGEKMFTSAIHKGVAIYYRIEETHAATDEELKTRKHPHTANQDKLPSYLSELEEKQIIIQKYEEILRKLFLSRSRKIPTNPITDLIVLNIETTGLNKDIDEILQVSIINSVGNVLLNTYVSPIKKKTWESAEKVHHISPQKVECAPFIYEVMSCINYILRKAKIVVGYNSNFDIDFLKHFGADFSNVSVFDVMLAFSPIYGEKRSKNKFKHQKLSVCANYFNYDWGETAHNSLGDCFATLYCYNKICEAGESGNPFLHNNKY